MWQITAAEAVKSTYCYMMCDMMVLYSHSAECLQWPAICPIRGRIGRPCSWVTASRKTHWNICHPLHTHTQPPHALTPGRLHLSVTYKNPPTTPPNPPVLITYRTKKRPCSYVTNLSHLEKISCCSNHSASPSSPPPHSFSPSPSSP